ncbi:MAG: polysaccharide biosynthesis protein, partial [Desulfobacteraceae bacterium]|nr:polysaccharide biosynthesis protein [Desulfobacteraceae bacterium]
KQREQGCVTITDPRMTRFWLSLDESVDLVTRAVSMMKGGEIFIPKIPSMKITDLAEALAPGCEQKVVGIRPGEKLHEVLINEDEGRYTVRLDGFFTVMPSRERCDEVCQKNGELVGENFIYASDRNDRWLSSDELRAVLIGQGVDLRP